MLGNMSLAVGHYFREPLVEHTHLAGMAFIVRDNQVIAIMADHGRIEWVK